ncbi:MAG: deoxyribonuclease IV [Clostridia bacterium]|nr:deoxyribonuclease IV [Clostridia bacterium]
MRLGAHLSIAKGLDKTVNMAANIGANTFQFFTRNPRGGAARQISEQEISTWKQARQAADLYPIAGHLPYTLNLGAADTRQQEFARMVLHDDARRIAALGGEFLISHPGHHNGNRKEALDRIVNIIKETYLSINANIPILLLETMAGQGKEIGSIDDLHYILAALNWPEKVGICLDTAHLFAAGWDLTTAEGCQQLVQTLKLKIGLERIKIMHLNDSLTLLGSKRDRHANLGKGEIGEKGLAAIVNNAFLGQLVLILETPVTNYQQYASEIAMVRALRS